MQSHIDSAYVESDTEFQGDVRIRVESTGHIRTVMLFVRELRRENHLRLLEVDASPGDAVYIRMTLGKPIPLIRVLRQNEWVSKVEVSQGEVVDGNEPQFNVQLVG